METVFKQSAKVPNLIKGRRAKAEIRRKTINCRKGPQSSQSGKGGPASASPVSHGPGSEAEFSKGESATPSEISPSLQFLVLEVPRVTTRHSL